MDFNIPDIIKLQELVARARRVVIVCHVSPDGDAIGSSLALRHVLSAMGKRPEVVTPDMPPRSLSHLPGVADIIVASRTPEKAHVHLQAADLIFCLDFNASMRLDRLEDQFLKAKAPKVLIDHHLDPEDFADPVFSHPQASSTCYLLYRVLRAAGWTPLIGTDAAACLATGIMTDTGNFSYNSNDPELYRVMADLVAKGIDKDRLYRDAINTSSLDSLRLCAFAIAERMEVLPAHGCAIIALSADDLKRHSYERGDTEGLVNKPLSVPGIVCSAFLREDQEQIKLSMRSKGNYPVNLICALFGGGGHLNASGAEMHCPLAEAVERLKKVIPEFDNYLTEHD